MQFSNLAIICSALATLASAAVIPESQRPTDQNSIYNLRCTDTVTFIPNHDINVAQLQICGSIAGTIQKCQGRPKATTGESGRAVFALNPVVNGATINISKGRWEQCIRAAKLTCGTHPFTAVCRGGASVGDVDFSLIAA